MDWSAKDSELERTEALKAETTSRRFPRRFSLPRALVFACELWSSSPDVSGGTVTVFLYGTGGNVVIRTQSNFCVLDDWGACDNSSLAWLCTFDREGPGSTPEPGVFEARFRFREGSSTATDTAGEPEWGRRESR